MLKEDFLINNLAFAKYDPNPIVLLDSSGSTSSVLSKTNKSIFKSYEIVLRKILRPEQYACYIGQWSITFYSNGLVNLDDYSKIKQHEGHCTNLDCALNFDNSIIKAKDHIEIYILTDGECSGGDLFSIRLKKLVEEIGSKLSIHIITLTNDSTDYRKENYTYGNQIHQIIMSNGLSKNIKKFLSFNNKYWEEPHIAILNPDYHDGYIPYLDKYFIITDLERCVF